MLPDLKKNPMYFGTYPTSPEQLYGKQSLMKTNDQSSTLQKSRQKVERRIKPKRPYLKGISNIIITYVTISTSTNSCNHQRNTISAKAMLLLLSTRKKKKYNSQQLGKKQQQMRVTESSLGILLVLQNLYYSCNLRNQTICFWEQGITLLEANP